MKTIAVLSTVALMVSPALGAGLTNGEFTSGLTGWTFDKSSWSPTYNFGVGNGGVWGPSSNDGTMLQLGLGGPGNFNEWEYQLLTGLTVGQQYTLTGNYAGGLGGAQTLNNGASGWWEIGLFPGSYSNATIDAGSASISKKSVAGTGNDWGSGFDWQAVNYTFTATSTQYVVYLKAGQYGANYQYFGAYFDHFSVTPEPASLLLLGLAMPFICRRRA